MKLLLTRASLMWIEEVLATRWVASTRPGLATVTSTPPSALTDSLTREMTSRISSAGNRDSWVSRPSIRRGPVPVLSRSCSEDLSQMPKSLMASEYSRGTM